MSVIVEVPGHGEVEFPDGMSDVDMEAAIRKNFMLQPKEQPKASFAEKVAGGLQKVTDLTPFGMAAKGMEKVGEWTEQIGYGAGGKVTDAAAKVVSPEVAAGLGVATNIATQAIPTFAGGLAGSFAKPAIQSGARTLMQSALKPSKLEHLSGKGARAVTTMLDEGVNVSQGGVNKLRSSIDGLNDEIAGIIQNSGARIDKNAVASRLQDVMKKYEASIDSGDLRAIENVWTEFLAHPQLAGKPDMAIQLAQKMKKSGNAKLGDAAYGMGLKPAAERDAYKGLVRGLKEEIASAEPAVAPLNARESDLINAHKIAANRVAMDANKNPLGLGALISQPWMLPVWMWDRSPLGKSMMARLMNSQAGNIGTGAGAGAGGLYGASQGQGALYP